MMSQCNNLSVLTIDDDPDMRRSIVSYLEDMGFTVFQASGGSQGIRMFEEHTPDLVFTDLMMPEVDGLAVVEAITHTSPETPVVVISGNASVEYAIQTMRKGAWDYITKPIHDFATIEKVADQVLDRALAIKTEREFQESLQNAVISQDRQIFEIGTRDPLTKLPTRNQIREKFSAFIINEEFNGDLFVVLIEVGNLKHITETFGHEYGDQILTEVSERLKTLLQTYVMLGKLETNEFVLMVANNPGVANFLTSIKKACFAQPIEILGVEVHLDYSMGIASFPHDGESIDTLLQHADIARANAKMTGKNRTCYYSHELWVQVQDRIALESGLRKGLIRNEFHLHYQPKMDANCRKMIGMEALIRWKPKGSDRLIPPLVFIPVLEETGLITEIGAWVLETACSHYVEWRKQGMGNFLLSVNVSAVQFHAGNLPERVAAILHKTAMPAECLCLELTESVVIRDLGEALATLNELSALGIKLSIDDFGTGYSSLSHIKNMPIDELKIDRSFVMNLPEDAASIAIVDSVLTMARGMNMNVVAEGVETVEQADFLTSRGCQELQGYLFTKPLPKDELFGWCHGKEHCDEHRAQDMVSNRENAGAVQQLAGGIAHDFKNLLTGVIGNLSIAKHHLEESHKSSQAIDRAEKASQRATELAQKLMNISRPVTATKQKTNVRAVVDECVALSLSHTMTGSSITADDELPAILMPEGELFQVVNNLTLNASQAMNGGGIVSVAVSSVTLEAGNSMHLSYGSYVNIRISDHGCGIPAEQMKKIFDPYFTTKPSGNGLGLASARALVRKNHGDIFVSSQPGEGTTAVILLPAG